MKRSTRASACPGGAASVKLGRRPFLVSAMRVNWLTTRSSPPVSSAERLNLPSSSGKMRRFRVLSARYAASRSVSEQATPRSTTRPAPIDPTLSAATLTWARLTR